MREYQIRYNAVGDEFYRFIFIVCEHPQEAINKAYGMLDWDNNSYSGLTIESSKVVEKVCHQCGTDYKEVSGVSHHIKECGGIDHDLDAEHTPYSDVATVSSGDAVHRDFDLHFDIKTIGALRSEFCKAKWEYEHMLKLITKHSIDFKGLG